MKIIKPYYVIEDEIDAKRIMLGIERAGRTCYKSEGKIGDGTAEKFIAAIIKRGHESVLEHEKITVRFICDRGVTHELVRHRIASYSQESTRYCNYSQDRFGSELTFIKPCFWEDGSENMRIWEETMQHIEDNYNKMTAAGAKPEEARSILPNSLKTEIVVTMNMREWRHYFKLRTSPAAHPQIREISIALLKEFKEKLPVLFSDIEI
ncbi:MAG: FAD-dependent thymidylate synthase [Firmicutes bacterium]|nr:FAD-dependent thymidylate synthase [Bacillota bacterium]